MTNRREHVTDGGSTHCSLYAIFYFVNLRVVCAKKPVGIFIELFTVGNTKGSWAELRIALSGSLHDVDESVFEGRGESVCLAMKCDTKPAREVSRLPHRQQQPV